MKSRKALLYGCLAALGLFAAIWMVIGILNLVVNPANITAGWHKANFDFAHPNREFTRDFDGNYEIFEGTYGGTERRGGQTYHHVQFPGVLVGADRHLDILFPGTILEKAIISESGQRIPGSPSAYLLYQRFCCVEMETTYALLDLQEGAVSDPAALLGDHFGHEITVGADPVIFCEMDFSNVFDHTTMCYLWERGPDGSMVVSAVGGSVVVPYDMDLEWTVRDRSTHHLRKVVFAGTVVADILTGPLQLAFWAVIGPGIVR